MTAVTLPTTVTLRTGAWYADRPLELSFPAGWDVRVLWPELPAGLAPGDVAMRVRSPVAGPPLRELARGARRVAVLVDDLTRPTPAAAILPHVLSELAAAGVPSSWVTVLLATGAHRVSPSRRALERKLGGDVLAACRVAVHRHTDPTVRVGTTSYGTPVLLDRLVAGADLLVGVGGVYPQHSVGFGGGTKIVLGVLGTRSIAALHYGHRGVDGTYDVDNDFRRDLDEIAALVRLRWVALGHVNADRELVRVTTGEPVTIHGHEVAWARSAFRTPPPGDADVVVANAYPMDVSLTFAHSKGVIPFSRARPEASRVLVAGCPEGAGRHDLFPIERGPGDRVRHLLRKAAAEPASVPSRGLRALRRRAAGRPGPRAQPAEGPIRPPVLWYGAGTAGFSGPTGGLVPVPGWGDVLDRVSRQHSDRTDLSVVVYPCAPLQVLAQG